MSERIDNQIQTISSKYFICLSHIYLSPTCCLHQEADLSGPHQYGSFEMSALIKEAPKRAFYHMRGQQEGVTYEPGIIPSLDTQSASALLLHLQHAELYGKNFFCFEATQSSFVKEVQMDQGRNRVGEWLPRWSFMGRNGG